MKKIFILLFLIIAPDFFAQNPVPCREIFLRTINTNSNNVTFRATTYQTYRWDNYGSLTSGFQEDFITLNGDTPETDYCVYGFSFNHDCSDPPNSIELGRNLYMITVDGKSSSVSYNANGCVFQGDLFITYDYDDDAFYQGGGCNSLGNNPLTSYLGYTGTSCLEEYWTHCLSLIASSENHPLLFWGPYPESVDIAGYNIYRKVGSGSYLLIHTNTDTCKSIIYNRSVITSD